MHPLHQWPAAQRRQIIGVFTDIDDTLTTDGAITADALQALADLKAAGLTVIPITGRPIGWCEPFMAGTQGPAWPVDAMVAENGAVAFVHEKGPQPASNLREPLSKLHQQDAAMRATNQACMQAIAAQVEAEVPGVRLSRDSAGRETDLAFDYAEFARLSPDTVQQVLAVLQRAGMQTTVSSIHIHGCFGNFNKWQGACWIARELLRRDLTEELDRWVFVGDSGNDQAMFEHFTHSVGVANIARFVPQLAHLPGYVTTAERGAGFAEVARAILQARGL
ncbi:HAD-IIB family hydrolase [Rhodoferax saidenbachensis]|uniref:HAD superfamily hydrolase (TIGR01484 family) n=1 Tax=Rhodoferax saidenbachensis TaxID=1484693 RepID=A0ABU1ZRD4_9BURK|nr:HAD-IIB family hydrolase [Rhodoferax saidenbachensis]MDR7308112.1 HAD superfamily hydrolase (TIGR01484 family) [Rhodoferax saidenbachensis]